MQLHKLPSTLTLFLSFLAQAPTLDAAPAPLDTTNQVPLSAEFPSTSPDFEIPTRYESTVLGRRLLHLSPTGVLSTIFPSSNSSSSISSTPPSSVANTPISLPDYLADCESSGNPTILALGVSTSTRNAAGGSNVSLSLSWWDRFPLYTHRQPWSPASLPRISLIGYLEEISLHEAKRPGGVEECFLKAHADAKAWLPGDEGAAHAGKWMRLRVREVYWIGGFGDRAWIGWFDAEEWRGVGEEEWRKVRLPGEEEEEEEGERGYAQG